MALMPGDEVFADLACLAYDESDSPERRAAAVVPAQLTLADAAAIGSPSAVASLIDDADVNAPVGPRAWAPLLYLTYSRVPQQDAVAAARVLLDAGASPTAQWGRWETPFTALTGCFGHGEMGPGRQPPHPDCFELAQLLLDHGADPNDEQTLYNRMFARSDDHLRFLLDRGLDDRRLLGEQLGWAIGVGYDERVALLSALGIEPIHRWSAPTEPPLHRFAWLDDTEMVQRLLDDGADPTLRDAVHGTTAYEWAEWAHARHAADLLRP